MSVELPRPDPVPLVPVVEFANPVRLLAAIADPVRYRALKELAAGLTFRRRNWRRRWG